MSHRVNRTAALILVGCLVIAGYGVVAGRSRWEHRSVPDVRGMARNFIVQAPERQDGV